MSINKRAALCVIFFSSMLLLFTSSASAAEESLSATVADNAITLADADTVNPGGVIPDAYATDGIPAAVTLTNGWFDGSNGVLIMGAHAADLIGYSVSRAGDVNDDGFDDLLIGAVYVDPNNMTSAGEAYLIYGRESGLPPKIILNDSWLDGTNGVIFAGSATGNFTGNSVSGAGDVNGDGCDDILVAAQYAHPNGITKAGEIYLIYGSRTHLPARITLSQSWFNGTNGVIFLGTEDGALAGSTVSNGGDFNDDGFSDFLISSHYANPGGLDDAGKAYLVFGRSSGIPAAVTLTDNWFNGTNGILFTGAKAGDVAGNATSGAGDVNGDGYDDLMICAPNADPEGRTSAGNVYLIYGRNSGLAGKVNLADGWFDGSNGVLLSGPGGGSLTSVSGAGDINGDTWPDLMIGAYFADPEGRTDAGKTYVIYGCSNGLPARITMTDGWFDGTNGMLLVGSHPIDNSGRSFSGVGDVNGDGLAEMLIAAYKADPNGKTDAGEVYLVNGSSSELPAKSSLNSEWLNGTVGCVLSGPVAGDQIGFSVSGAGDVNGDGCDDILFSSIQAEPGSILNSGAVYLIFGRKPFRFTPVSPAFGPVAGNFEVVISGINLCDGSISDIISVKLCGYDASVLSVAGSTQIVVIASAASSACLGSVEVSSLSHGTTVKANAFEYQEPILTVLGINGLPVVNGDPADKANGTDFGAVPVGSSRTHTFAITNTGNASLRLTNFSFSNINTSELTFEQHAGSVNPIPVGGVLSYDLIYTPTVHENLAGYLSIESSASNSPFILNLRGSYYSLSTASGPFGGKNSITINHGDVGNITNVLVGGISAKITAQGMGWITIDLPPAASEGVKDIILQTSDDGDITLEEAYTVNPAGKIGWEEDSSSKTWTGLGAGIDLFGTVNALLHTGTKLYAAGDFSLAGGVPASNIALWDGTTWHPLGNGLNGTVNALASDGTHLYAGGSFTMAGGVAASNIAMWDGDEWIALGGGVNGTVKALLYDGANLYVGGAFTTTGGSPSKFIAKWNGTLWSPLGIGVDNTVNALAHDGTNLYVGGVFRHAGAISANYVAMWNGSGWKSLGSGPSSTVYTLTHDGSNLYVGGSFIAAGGAMANFAAKWNGSVWSGLNQGFNASVRAMTCVGTNLYAGGDFESLFSPSLRVWGVAEWNGSNWSALSPYLGVDIFHRDGNYGVNGPVFALAGDGTSLYVGGMFTNAVGVTAINIAKWGPSRIANFGVSPTNGTTSGGYQVVISGTNLCNGTLSDVLDVTLCGMSVTSIDSVSGSTQIVVTAAGGYPGLGDVRVISDSYGETVKVDAFTYIGLNPPTALKPTQIARNAFRANWTLNTDAASYAIDVSTSSNFTSFVSGYAEQNVGNTAGTWITGLNEDTWYWYRVRACSATDVQSMSSNIIGVPTGDDIPWVMVTNMTGSASSGGTQEFALDLIFAGSGLTYAVTSDAPTVVSAIIDSVSGILRLTYGQPGVAMITITATHTATGYSVSYSFTVTVLPAPAVSIGPLSGNSMEVFHLVSVKNTSGQDASGVMVIIGNLDNPEYILNKTGVNGNGDAVVEYPQTLPQGASIQIKVLFARAYGIQLAHNHPATISAFLVLTPLQKPPSTTASASDVHDIWPRVDGTVVIAFATVPGTEYMVQYRDALVGEWKNAYPYITATSTVTYWIDSGQPATDPDPSTVSSRFYRILSFPSSN